METSNASAGRPASPAQLRAARALLDWTLVAAAQRAGISVSAVLRCERRERGGRDDADVRALAGAYRTAGVRFRSGAAEGVEVSALLNAAEADAGRRAG